MGAATRKSQAASLKSQGSRRFDTERPTFTIRTMQLKSYAAGQWVAGSGKQAELVDASTGELVATSSGGLDFGH